MFFVSILTLCLVLDSDDFYVFFPKTFIVLCFTFNSVSYFIFLYDEKYAYPKDPALFAEKILFPQLNCYCISVNILMAGLYFRPLTCEFISSSKNIAIC